MYNRCAQHERREISTRRAVRVSQPAQCALLTAKPTVEPAPCTPPAYSHNPPIPLNLMHCPVMCYSAYLLLLQELFQHLQLVQILLCAYHLCVVLYELAQLVVHAQRLEQLEHLVL